LQDDDDEDDELPEMKPRAQSENNKEQTQQQQLKTPPLPPERTSQPTPTFSQGLSGGEGGNKGQLAAESKLPPAAMNENMKKVEEFWHTLNTEDGIKISGNEVKKLSGKSENRKSLSKIWKLCNSAYKGSLSKG
jgi:hypothetical protein